METLSFLCEEFVHQITSGFIDFKEQLQEFNDQYQQ